MKPAWRLVSALTVLAVALAGAITAWLVTSSRTADHVSVQWMPEAPLCTGGQLRYPRNIVGHGPVIVASRRTRCVITVLVTNRSGRTVHLASAVGDFLGSQSGLILQATNATGTAEQGRAARFSLDKDLPAGHTYRFPIRVAFRPSGCDQAYVWIKGFPTITLTSLGITHHRAARDTFSVVQQGPSPGCHA